jgi:hypothetical protein
MMTAALVRNMAFRGRSSFLFGRAKLAGVCEQAKREQWGRGSGKGAYKSEKGSPPCRAKAAVSLEEDVTTSVDEQERMMMMTAAITAVPALDEVACLKMEMIGLDKLVNPPQANALEGGQLTLSPPW